MGRVDRPAALIVLLLVLGVVGTQVLMGGSDDGGRAEAAAHAGRHGRAAQVRARPGQAGRGSAQPVAGSHLPAYPKVLPHGETSIFGDDRLLVAYYGTAGTGSLGVLGETGPDTAFDRLQDAAAPFARRHSAVQPVYELIVTVADGTPGADGSYSHDIARSEVAQYIRAAHRHGALLLLDLQPGRSGFLTVARRWGWALHDPYVGLALDPEWRMRPGQVPAQTIGSVGAPEVNRTSAWLQTLVRRNHLPQKLFVLHQFRASMIRDLDDVRTRAGLATVQHVDGYGTPGQKLATFHSVVRPSRFTLGFKLFYHQDVPRMTAAQVRRVRPRVRFVSFQ